MLNDDQVRCEKTVGRPVASLVLVGWIYRVKD